MKYFVILLICAVSARSEEVPQPQQASAHRWNVELPPPAPQDVSQPDHAPEPIEFEILSTRSKDIHLSETPEMPDLPPVEGFAKVTIQKVADPRIPEPPPPLPALPPEDPAVIARLQELRGALHETTIVFASAIVVDGARTRVTIYPNGQAGDAVTAWSNVNFLYFSGQGGYRVTSEDGTIHDYALLMGIGSVDSVDKAASQIRAGAAGQEYGQWNEPTLSDIEAGGPAFFVVEGPQSGPAIDVLEQLHDLYLKSGRTLEDAYRVRQEERTARREQLLANPPKPRDITVRVWRRSPNQTAIPQNGGAQ